LTSSYQILRVSATLDIVLLSKALCPWQRPYPQRYFPVDVLSEVGDKLRPSPDKAKILRNIGTAYEKKGDARNAQKYCQQAEAMERGLKKDAGLAD
jgi:hypothetical protein